MKSRSPAHLVTRGSVSTQPSTDGKVLQGGFPNKQRPQGVKPAVTGEELFAKEDPLQK